mmetsp:Transcript_15169/g.47155  ORF Transcript_15169/g.47155 Transcript_15169/m.47155 type:complete len:208 (+) Transcript_15169:1288-1911(+)
MESVEKTKSRSPAHMASIPSWSSRVCGTSSPKYRPIRPDMTTKRVHTAPRLRPRREGRNDGDSSVFACFTSARKRFGAKHVKIKSSTLRINSSATAFRMRSPGSIVRPKYTQPTHASNAAMTRRSPCRPTATATRALESFSSVTWPLELMWIDVAPRGTASSAHMTARASFASFARTIAHAVIASMQRYGPMPARPESGPRYATKAW